MQLRHPVALIGTQRVGLDHARSGTGGNDIQALVADVLRAGVHGGKAIMPRAATGQDRQQHWQWRRPHGVGSGSSIAKVMGMRRADATGLPSRMAAW